MTFKMKMFRKLTLIVFTVQVFTIAYLLILSPVFFQKLN